MLAMAENYRANVRVVQRSRLPIERKQVILTRLLEQITVLIEDTSGNLSAQVEDLTEEERTSLQEIYAETEEALNELEKQP